MKFVNEAFIFKDRADAGKKLAKFLQPEYQKTHPLVIGIPRGGVEVAYYVAEVLKTDLEVLISKKLPYPGNKEYGFGAIAENGTVYIDEERSKGLSTETVQTIIDKQLREIQLRIQKYRKGRIVSNMQERVVILVDDGIATGVTLVPLLQLCREKGAARWRSLLRLLEPILTRS